MATPQHAPLLHAVPLEGVDELGPQQDGHFQSVCVYDAELTTRQQQERQDERLREQVTTGKNMYIYITGHVLT